MISIILDKKRSFSEPALTIASCNIEGINSNNEELLTDLCKEILCDVLCVQETYRSEDMNSYSYTIFNRNSISIEYR